jgi:phage baseplate assembly protein W
MAIPQIVRVNPLDLQKNIAIGVALPFGASGTDKLFTQTFSTKDQIKSNLINLLLTNRGERILNPNFGSDLKRILFEPITPIIEDNIRDTINTSASIYIPEITINEIIIDTGFSDNNQIIITINYILNISGTADQVTIQFQ